MWTYPLVVYEVFKCEHLKEAHNVKSLTIVKFDLTFFYRGKNNVIKRYLLSAGVFKTSLYSIMSSTSGYWFVWSGYGLDGRHANDPWEIGLEHKRKIPQGCVEGGIPMLYIINTRHAIGKFKFMLRRMLDTCFWNPYNGSTVDLHQRLPKPMELALIDDNWCWCLCASVRLARRPMCVSL